jgi:hypothetical protein
MEIFLKQAIAQTITFPLLTAGSATRKTGATLAAGDFLILRHTGGAWTSGNTTTTTPTEIGTSGIYALPLTATELTPDDQQYPIVIACHDVAGAQWDDQVVIIRIFDQDLDSLPAAIWASATRTLTSFGTLIADIWTYVTRTLTPSTVSVWSQIVGFVDQHPHVGDTLRILIVILDVDNKAMDISAATVKEFHAKPPTGATRTWTASFLTGGVDGILYYHCAVADLDQPGPWKVQAYIEIPVAEQWHADVYGFEVLANL